MLDGVVRRPEEPWASILKARQSTAVPHEQRSETENPILRSPKWHHQGSMYDL